MLYQCAHCMNFVDILHFVQNFCYKHNNLVNDYLNKAVNQIKKIVKEKKIKNIVIGYNKGLKNKGIKNDLIKGKYSGERIKRGLYETHKGILVNADINASLNILRKSNPNLECIKLLRGRGLTIPTRIQVNL